MKKDNKTKDIGTMQKTKRESAAGIKLMFLLILLCICLFGWLFYKSYGENAFLEKAQAFVDNEIDVANEVFLNVRNLAVAQSDASPDNIKDGLKIFQTHLEQRGLSDRDAGFDAVELKKVTDAQLEISTDWGILQTYAQPIIENQKLISDTLNETKETEKLLTELQGIIKIIQADLNKAVEVDVLDDALLNMSNQLEQVGLSIVAVRQSNANYDEIFRAARESISFYENNLARFNRELRITGANVFVEGKATQAQLNLLVQKSQKLRNDLGDLNSTARAYMKLKDNLGNIDEKERQLIQQLQALRGIYYGKDRRPFGFLPFDYSTSMLIVGVAILILFFLLFTVSVRRNQRLLSQTRLLQEAAEARNKNDQEAILRLMDELADFSEGDLTVEAQVTEDFTGAIADSINFAIESMREMVTTIKATSREIQDATQNVGSVSALLENSSIEQSKQVNRTNETAQRMAMTLDNIAENTSSSAEIARSSVNIAKAGKEKVLETVSSMNDIRSNIQETSKHIKKLGESSQEIGDIIEIIKSITDQTNILSLNAAIQATFAGEAGRGFAVVADEIQRLSERSANASKRIEVLIKTIQADANEAVSSMETSTRRVVSGAEVAEEAGDKLDKIEGVSTNLANLIINVSKATRSAADMSKGVSLMMDNLTAINERSGKDVKESVDSFSNIETLSNELKQSVSHFKLPH